MRDLWELEENAGNFTADCGEAALQHWLYIHSTLFDDLPHIQHRVVFHFERFATGDTLGLAVWALQLLHICMQPSGNC